MSEFLGALPTTGEEYLTKITQLHEAGDGVYFTFSPVAAFQEELEHRDPAKNLDVAGFLAGFAKDAEDRRKQQLRWDSGIGLPRASDEVQELIQSKTPSHVAINPEAIGGIQLKPARHYKIDIVSDDIMAEVAALLPRRIDAYDYRNGYAQDTVEVPGLGEVQVQLHNSNDIFRSISEVSIGDFRIWNCRQTGLWYNGNLIDISHPTDIEIGDERLQIQLYSDQSGIFVKKDGKRFTNERVMTRYHQGHQSDNERDELYRTYNGLNPLAPVEDGEASNEGWDKDETELSWHEIQDQAVVWMAEHILFPLKQAQKPEVQASELPEEEPYPFEKLGPIFTFIETRDLEKVERVKGHPESVYPDERYAIRPGYRLVPPLTKSSPELPELAYDGYIYARPGNIMDIGLEDIRYIGRERRNTDNLLGHAHGFAQIHPKSAKDIYVVDWAEWDKYREATFSDTHDRLTDAEMGENYAVVARTMVPVTEYDGSFKDPIVLIGRKLELDEIEFTLPAPESQRF